MAQSYKEYPSGSVTLADVTYAVPFKYLSINDVNVIGFDGDSWTPLALDASAPRNATNKTVTLATAPNTLYTKIRLYRASSTTQLVDFQNGSRLSESDLDTAYQQGLFAAQEVAEDASTSQFTAVRDAKLQAGTSLSNFKSQEFTGDNSATAFNITAFAPATEVNEAYRVSIDGVMQAPSDYAVSMSPAKITFTSAPPTGSKIVVVTAASAASAVSVDDVTIGLTSTNKVQVKDGAITQDKLSTGGPRWSATAGRLYVDGVDSGSGTLVAGLQINENLVGDQGYAFIDLHGDNTGTSEYVRLLNTNGTCQLQNKKAGSSILLETTDSGGTLRTGLRVDAAQNVIVSDSITGDSNTGRIAIFGGTQGNGANIELYAGSHANGPNKAYFDASQHWFRSVTGGDGAQVLVRGKLHVKPINYTSNQDGYLLQGGTTDNTAWDNFGIKLKSTSTGSPRMSASSHTQDDLMTWNNNKVGINTASPSATLTVNGSINYSGSLTDTSDHRLKENVNDLSGSLDKLTRLNGKSYTMIDDEEGQTEFGFIAQEVKEVFPEVVKEIQQYELDENGEETTEEVNYIGVSYVQLIAPMVEAIKELKSQNETLEARIESLENA